MIRFLLVICCFLLSATAFGQERNEIIQQRVEFIAEQTESEEFDLTNLFDQLNYYYSNPINLNNTDQEELRTLGLLTDVQINEVFVHIKQFGKFISIYELQSMKYWDLSTIQLVLPFVIVDDRFDQMHITFKEALKSGKYEQYLRFQATTPTKAGYEKVSDSLLNSSNSYYHGNEGRYYARFRY